MPLRPATDKPAGKRTGYGEAYAQELADFMAALRKLLRGKAKQATTGGTPTRRPRRS